MQNRIDQNKSRMAWRKPVLTTYGKIEELTGQSKTFGAGDGFILVIPGVGDVPIQDYGGGS